MMGGNIHSVGRVWGWWVERISVCLGPACRSTSSQVLAMTSSNKKFGKWWIQWGSENFRRSDLKWIYACWVLSQLGCGQLCDPMDGSPLASSVQWILQTTVVEWVTVPFSKEIFLTQGLNPCLVSPTLAGGFFTTAAATAAKSLQSCPTLCDPIDGSPPSLGFSRQEHWNGLPLAAPNMYN